MYSVTFQSPEVENSLGLPFPVFIPEWRQVSSSQSYTSCPVGGDCDIWLRINHPKGKATLPPACWAVSEFCRYLWGPHPFLQTPVNGHVINQPVFIRQTCLPRNQRWKTVLAPALRSSCNEVQLLIAPASLFQWLGLQDYLSLYKSIFPNLTQFFQFFQWKQISAHAATLQSCDSAQLNPSQSLCSLFILLIAPFIVINKLSLNHILFPHLNHWYYEYQRPTHTLISVVSY